MGGYGLSGNRGVGVSCLIILKGRLKCLKSLPSSPFASFLLQSLITLLIPPLRMAEKRTDSHSRDVAVHRCLHGICDVTARRLVVVFCLKLIP